MSATAQPGPPLGLKDVFAIPAFRQLWISQLVSIFGDFLALYAVIAMVSFRMHGTAREVTLISVSFLLPLALISPIAGVFVDRWDPRRTMIASDLIRAALILGLVFSHAPWHVYIVFFAISTFSSFFVPAQSVVLPQIVPLNGLLSANAGMQQAMQLVRIVSPVLSGTLVGWLGGDICYYIDSASFLISAAMLSRIQVPPRPQHANREMDSVLKDVFSGMRFILTHPVIGFVMVSIAAGMFSLGAFGSLTALYVRDVLHLSGRTGSYMYGTLGSMVGLGMLIGGGILTKVAQKFENKAKLITLGLLACGMFIALIAAVNTVAVAVLGCIGIGLSASLLIIPSMALMQGQVPHEMRGRVSSSAMSMMTLTQGIALLFSGDFAARFGIIPVYFGSAVILMLIAMFGFFRTQPAAIEKGA